MVTKSTKIKKNSKPANSMRSGKKAKKQIVKAVRAKAKAPVKKSTGKKPMVPTQGKTVKQAAPYAMEPDTKKLLSDDDPELLDMAQREKIPQVMAGDEGDDEVPMMGEEEGKDKFSLPEDDDTDIAGLSDEEDDDF